MHVTAPRTLDPASMRDWLLTIKPRPQPRVTSDGDGDVVGRILAVLLRSRFRKGSLESMDAPEFVARHRDRVAARVGRDAPVQLTLVGFPFKVPNPLKVGARTLPDLAEVAALRTFERLCVDVRNVYPPGIEIVILHDGAYIAEAFGVPVHEADEYADYFRWLLRVTRTDAFIRCEDIVHFLGAHPCDGAAHEAVPCTITDEAEAFRKTLGMLNVRWVRRKSLPTVYAQVRDDNPGSLTVEAAALYSQVRQSMVHYRVCDDLLHRRDPRPFAFPDAIHATTKEQPGRLALWLVRRGRAHLPWHGVGVLDGTGRIDVKHAAEVEGNLEYRPVFLEGETTPFFYERV